MDTTTADFEQFRDTQSAYTLFTTRSRQKRGNTAAVINLLLSQPRLTLDQISEELSIHRRSVNALVYALEIQQRVVAHSYDELRRNQKFCVISAKYTEIAPEERVHPSVAKRTSVASKMRRENESILSFFSHGIVSSPIALA